MDHMDYRRYTQIPSLSQQAMVMTAFTVDINAMKKFGA